MANPLTQLGMGMQLRTKPKAPVHPVISFAKQFWINVQANLE
jgi:hypothetical protein